jgi:hypothetical protein
MIVTDTLVWSKTPLANRALRVGHLAHVAVTRAAVQAAIRDRVLPEHRAVVETEAADAERDARYLLGQWARLSSALEVSDPRLAAVVDAAVWGQRPVAAERSAA